MFLKVFNSKNTSLQFLLIAIIWAGILIVPVQVIPNYGFNPLYDILINLLGAKNWLIKIVFSLLIFSPLIATQYFSTKFGLLKRKNFHFLFIAPLLIFSNINSWSINPALLSVIFIIIGIIQLFKMSYYENIKTPLSQSAFFFSLASLAYTVLIFDIFLIFISLVIFRHFKIRELTIAIISFLLPYIYIFSWYYLNDNFTENWCSLIHQFKNISLMIKMGDHWADHISLFIITILGLYISISAIGGMRTKLIQIRGFIIFILWSLAGSILALFITDIYTPYHYFIILFIISILFSIYLSDNRRNWIMESIILLLTLQYIFIIYKMLYA